jgi:hypothetical protein
MTKIPVFKQQEEEQEQEAQKVIWEFEVTEAKGGQIFSVVRSFMMKVFDAPLQRVIAGQLVGLSPETAAELFYCGKITPVDIAELGEYEVLQDIRIIIGERYKRLKPKDMIELSKSEALSLLREQKVKFIREVKENESEIPEINPL